VWTAATTSVRLCVLAFATAALLLLGFAPASAGNGNPRPPKPPSSLAVTATTPETISLAWQAPKGGKESSHYDLYVDDAPVASTGATSYTFAGLACGHSYSFGVESVDEAGTHSSRTTGVGSTTPCAAPAPPAPATDSSSPTVPGALRVTGVDGTSLALAWSASVDDVGVTEYAVYVEGSEFARTRNTAAVVGGLACGRTYDVAVTARDAAGNESARDEVSSSTAACPPPSDGAAYYVSTAGSDANPGTLAAPWRTIAKAMSTLAAGQTAYVRAGTYAETTDRACDSSYNTLTWSRSGTASAPITISGYPGESSAVVIKTKLKLAGSFVRLANLIVGHNTAYSSFDSACTGEPNVVVSGDDVTLDGLTIQNSNMSGIYLSGADRVTIVGNRIRDNGTHAALDHGVYYGSGVGGTIANNIFERNRAYGIQMYPHPQGQVITQNVITGSGKAGMILSGASDLTVVNNISAWNAEEGIRTGGGGCSGCSADQNVLYGNARNYYLPTALAVGSTISADPLFANRAAGDYHLASGSPGVDAARPAFSMAVDLARNPRPAGGGPDVGAFER
jgi:parallel beta-helix repeat protein